MVVNVQQEGILVEVCLVASKQERSDVVAVWDEAKALALPVCCVDHVPPSQENLGKDHLTLKIARKVVETCFWGATLVRPRLLGVGIPG